MNITAFTGPDTGNNLIELIRATPLARGDACIIVPDIHVANTVERCLADMSGDICFGHRLYTFDAAARAIMSKGSVLPDKIDDNMRHALMGELVRGRIAPDSPLADIAGYDGFINILETYIRDIRSTDLEPSWKLDAELSAIVRVYDVHLRISGKTDPEGAVIDALAEGAVEQFTDRFDGALILHGFYDFTDRQFALVERLCLRFKRVALTLPYDAGRKDLFALSEAVLTRFQKLGARIIDVPREHTHSAGMVMSGFMGGTYPDQCDSVEIHTFRSEASEADWLAGTINRLLNDGVCDPSDILVVSRDRPGYGGPLHSTMRRHGIPLDGSIARPLKSHPLIHLIFDAIKASVLYDNDKLLKQVIGSPFTITAPETADTQNVTTDIRGWSCMLADQDTPEGYAASVRKMLDYLRVPETFNGGGDSNCALQEILAYQRFLELLDEFVGVYTPFRRMMKAGEFADLLWSFTAQADMPDVPVCPGGVTITDAGTARHISRKIVFMTGMSVEAFPRKHDPFRLHPHELSRIVTQRRDREEGLLFYLSCTGAEKIYFTFPGIDDEGTESGMSPYLTEIRDGCETRCVHEFHKGVSGSCWQGGAVGKRGEWELMVRSVRNGHFTENNSVDTLSYAHSDGTVARALTRYADLVARDRLSIDAGDLLEAYSGKWGPDRIFSVTGLENWIACPLDFFFSHILGIRPEWLVEDEIDPAGMGSFIHGLLADFYRTVSVEHIDMATAELAVLYGVGERAVDRAMAQYGDISHDVHPVVARTEIQRIRQWMKSFISVERDRLLDDGFRPVHLEIPFGDMRDTGSLPPLVIEREGELVRMSGRIDRIDKREQDGVKQVRIIDYKTGSGYGIPGKSVMLQLPLYLKAALMLVEPESTAEDSYYYMLRNNQTKSMFRKSRGGRTVAPDDPQITDAEERALQAVHEIRERIFTGNACGCTAFCSFRSLCASSRLGKDCLSNADQ